jgi:hypothetical protein
MAIQAHTWQVGEVVTAANMNTYLRDNIADLDSRIFEAKTGTYQGNGSTSQGITGIGFRPIYVRIWEYSVSGTVETYETTTDMVADHASGGAFTDQGVPGGAHHFITSRIISLDADGFTVDDGGTDEHPNENGQTYNYFAVGG